MEATEKATAGTMAKSNTEQKLSYNKFIKSSSGQVRQFMNIIFEPDDIVELRLIKQGSPPKKEWSLAKNFPDRVEGLRELNQQGYNIYIGVNPRVENGVSGDKNIEIARTLFVDFDHLDDNPSEEVRSRISATGLPEPTMTINSGHGIHCYWRLTHPITDMAVWREYMSALISALDSDPQIKNPERIMRLPGFMNVKRQPFVPCTIVSSNNQVYDVERIEQMLFEVGYSRRSNKSSNVYQNYHEDSDSSSSSGTSVSSGISVSSSTSASSGSRKQTSSIGKSEQGDTVEMDDDLKSIFLDHLPLREGNRRRCMLQIARKLKGNNRYADKSPASFYEYFKLWHKLAVPNMREENFEVNWKHFCYVFSYAYQIEELPIMGIFRRAVSQTPPAELERKFPMVPHLYKLVLLCRQLHRESETDDFFLDQRTAAQLVNISQKEVSRSLNLLRKEGYIELKRRGRTKGNPGASEYKYIAKKQHDTES